MKQPFFTYFLDYKGKRLISKKTGLEVPKFIPYWNGYTKERINELYKIVSK